MATRAEKKICLCPSRNSIAKTIRLSNKLLLATIPLKISVKSLLKRFNLRRKLSRFDFITMMLMLVPNLRVKSLIKKRKNSLFNVFTRTEKG